MIVHRLADYAALLGFLRRIFALPKTSSIHVMAVMVEGKPR